MPAPVPPHDWFHLAVTWLLSTDVTGAVTWLGTIFGLIALAATYYQVSAARTAAEAARDAVTGYERRISIGAFAYSTAQIGILKQLMQSGNFAAASIVFASMHRSILHIIENHNNSPAQQARIPSTRRALQTVQTQIRHAVHEPETYRSIVADKALDGLSGALILLETEAATFRSQEDVE